MPTSRATIVKSAVLRRLVGGPLIEIVADQRAGLHQLGSRRLADRALGAVRCQGRRLGRTELAIELGLNQQNLVAIGHRGHAASSRRAACANSRRARHSRDMTAPIGVCVTSAISLYESSSSSRSTRV